MPRVFFTGRRKIPRNDISIVFRPGRPPTFEATLDLSKYRRSLPHTAKVFAEAYHNTMYQRFDFGTVADCRPRSALQLTDFDEWDRPRFRVRIVDHERDPGAVLASCERVDAVDPEQGESGGRSMLKLYPQPDSRMNGELWRLVDRGGFQLWYNKDVAPLASNIKRKLPDALGMILPAALREILCRTHLWESIDPDPTEWTEFAVRLSGEPFPHGADGESPTKEDVEEWIDGVLAAFCRRRARFVERIAALEEEQS